MKYLDFTYWFFPLRFREELQEISKTIKRRNEHRNPKYEWLDPEVVPNSISI